MLKKVSPLSHEILQRWIITETKLYDYTLLQNSWTRFNETANGKHLLTHLIKTTSCGHLNCQW